MRLDLYLAKEANISRSRAEKAIEKGEALLNGSIAKKNTSLSINDEIEYTPEPPKEISAKAEDIPLDVVYEDSDIIIINKPSGMVVHPAAGNYEGTLVNALLSHCKDSLSGIGGELRPGIVHRIDKDTTGLLCVAKNDRAHLLLSEQLKDKTLGRIYYTVCVGGFPEDEGVIDAPIARHPVDRKKMAVVNSPDARNAVTHYKVLERFEGYTCLRLQLETGRTHQIRVHLSYRNRPILGDPVYKNADTPFEKKHRSLFMGQLLHAGELSLVHPATGEKMTFYAPLPENFQEVLRIMRECNRNEK